MEEDLREFRTEVQAEIRDLRMEMNTRFAEMNMRFDRMEGKHDASTRWLVGLVLLSWLSLMGSLWLKS